jgi:pimeloyl-ACP methyl ester carboxylesterase
LRFERARCLAYLGGRLRLAGGGERDDPAGMAVAEQPDALRIDLGQRCEQAHLPTWGSLAGKHEFPPTAPFAEVLAQVRAQGPGGFDPVPYLQRLTIPVFWVFGDDDRNVPTPLCVERLQPLQAGHDFSWTVLPMAHSLIDLPSSLYSSLRQFRGFAAGLFPVIGDWLRSRRVVD